MKSTQPLDCNLHDYLELACMRGYWLDVELVDGQRLIARALSTRTTDTNEEFIVLEQNKSFKEIGVTQLAAITPLNSGVGNKRMTFSHSA